MQQIINEFARSATIRGENLLAGRTGTTATSVLAFNTLTTNLVGIGAAEVSQATTAANGTIITLATAGIYMVSLGTTVPASGDLELGIGVGVAQPFTADPDLTVAGVEATARVTAPAATSECATLIHIVTVRPGTTQLVYLLASDGAGAAPAAGDITAAQTYFQVDLIQNLAGT